MSFVSPIFLTLLGLVVLPVIIHLIHRQKYRIHDFSTLLFFDRSRKYNVFRPRLRHLLLLCLRIAAVALAVLAFARPSALHLPLGGQQQAAVLVLDGSYSMTQLFGPGDMLEFAKAQAARSVGEMGAGAAVGVVLNTEPPRLLLPPTSDREAARKAIESVKPFHRKGSSWAAVETARRALGSVRASAKQVVVFTDLQRSSWVRNSGDTMLNSTELSIVSPEFPELPVKFVALRPRSGQNCALVGVDVPAALVTVGRPARFAPTIRNFTDKPVKGLKITAAQGRGGRGRELAGETMSLDLPPRGTVKANFFFTFSLPGFTGVRFTLDDDALLADNAWVEAVSVTDILPVLCLGEEAEAKGEAAGDLFYLSNALAPAGRSSHLSLVVSPLSQLAKMGLYGYRCVFLSAVRGLGEKEAAAIRQYASKGGGVVIFLGTGTDEASLRALLAENGSAPISPVEVGGFLQKPARVAGVDFHPSVIGPELGTLADQLLGVSYTSRYRVSPRRTDDPSLRTLATFEDGTPAVVEARCGFGRSVLFAGGCSPSSTDLPFRPIFPALVQELARQLAQPIRSHAGEVRPGEAFLASFEEAERPKEVRVLAPDGRARPVSLREGKGDYAVAFGETSQPGLYQVQALYEGEKQETTVDAFAVNTGGADSDLQPASPKEVAARDSRASVETIEEPVLRSGLLATDRREWMAMLLALVLAVVLAENLISWMTK